jgi:hypothetical protein
MCYNFGGQQQTTQTYPTKYPRRDQKNEKNMIQKLYKQPNVCNGHYQAKFIQLNECS